MEKFFSSIEYGKGVGIVHLQQIEGCQDVLVVIYGEQGDIRAISYVEVEIEEEV
jgi:hypothetical protein